MLARWVGGASDERLKAVMGSPLRALLLWQIFTTMRQRFDPRRAQGLHAIVEFRIRRTRGRTIDRYQVTMTADRCTPTRRSNQAPTVTLDMDSVSFLRLVSGSAAAPSLLLRGKLKVHGNILLAARLPSLLSVPKPPDRLRF